jgi:hypothetical protein
VNFLFKPGAGVTDTWGECLYRKGSVSLDVNDRAMLAARMRIKVAQMQLPLRARHYPESWGGWVAYDPKIAREMCDVIEQQALPMLRSLASIDDFVAFASDKTRFIWTYLGSNYFNEPFVYAARGDFEGALAVCRNLPMLGSTRPQIEDLLPRLAGGDREGVAQLLHGWEAGSVKRLKLEKFWERTPFPIEVTT